MEGKKGERVRRESGPGSLFRDNENSSMNDNSRRCQFQHESHIFQNF